MADRDRYYPADIDVPLLIQQKEALLRAKLHADREDVILLEGILNLLDYIHDTIDPPLEPWAYPNELADRPPPRNPLDTDPVYQRAFADRAAYEASLATLAATPQESREKAKEAALARMCDEYAAWNKANGLNLGSADEVDLDALTPEQRTWIVAFSRRWQAVEAIR